MKFLLIHDGGDTKTAKRLLGLIKKHEPGAGECIPGESQEGLEGILEQLPHALCLILFISQSLIPPWVFFIGGYSMALKIPLLLYGAAPEQFGPVLSKRLIPIKNEHELAEYIGREPPEFFTRETRNRAKYELLENGIPFNEESLAACVIAGNKNAAALFLEAGFSPNARDRYGVALLNLAARMGDRNMVKLLLKAGADVNQQAEDRLSTALMDGIAGKHHGIVKDLLAAGADVNLKSRDGQSALIIAVGLNDEFSAELLLKAGANADEPDSLGASGRKYAALFNKPAMVSLFNIYAPQKNAG
jgi:ankyrin repeat protein